MTTEARCDVGIIMGSQSDWETMRHAAETLDRLGVAYETRIVSAHRTPDRLYEYAHGAQERGLKAIIAGAGGAAHLPGMAAAMTPLPVLGVPVESRTLRGVDSLLSIVQMPAGVPVATFAIGQAGAVNAALFAAAILALADAESGRRAGRVAAGADRGRGRAPGSPARKTRAGADAAAGEHDRHSRRRSARPHDRAGRRQPRLPHAHLCQRARFAGRAGIRRLDDRAVRRCRRARPLRRRRSTSRPANSRMSRPPRCAASRAKRPVLPRPRDHRNRPGPAARKEFLALDRRRHGRVPRGGRAPLRSTRRRAISAARRC